MYEKMSEEIFPDFNLALIHGKLKQCDKDATMRKFQSGEIDILVTTTVIEVGVNVARATLMVVEHAERFGLSQLHQLRGRVGRSELESQCILMTDFRKSEVAERRLDIMESTTDGFKIAEEDLEIRGPGEFLGTRQSGLPGFRLANIVRDRKLLEFAKDRASEVLSSDPELLTDEFAKLRGLVEIERNKTFWN
jgi:ATP-dependent DNA helicase RecG